MITKKTVFVLGAGASKPYGFPLGSELAENIIAGLSDDRQLKTDLLKADFRVGDVEEFRDRLIDSGGRSIDFFLEDQTQELVAIGVAAIALEIKRAEAIAREKHFVVRNPPDPSNHWLQHIWEKMRPGTSIETLSNSSIAFVTFNYDRIVEEFFSIVFKSHFPAIRDKAEAQTLVRNTIPIIHLHGELLQEIPFGNWAEDLEGRRIREASRDFRLINDRIAPDPSRMAATEALLKTAEQIVILGFGYHRANTIRLGLDRIVDGVAIYGSCFKLPGSDLAQAHTLIKRPWVPGKSDQGALEFLSQNVRLF